MSTPETSVEPNEVPPAPVNESPSAEGGDAPSDEVRPTEPLKTSRCVLEDFTRCSESHLWKLMMSFYDRKGVESWSQGIVPHFITSNSYIGRAYAKVLHGYIRDAMSASPPLLNVAEPLYIVELGTGSGKFSFYMLKALIEMEATCAFPSEKIVYVMTDFTEANFKFWTDHPSLAKYVAEGRLEFAIFDATNDREITLANSGKKLTADSLVNPLVVVANYLFDTLYHDIFQVEANELKEGLISTGSKNAEEPDPLEPDIIKRLDNRYQYNTISDNYYNDEEGDELHFQRLLAWYRDYFGASANGASILVPIGALRALRRLTAFSGGRALVISGDKGHNNPDHFSGLMDPHIAVHGSFSVMVNYHAIGTYFTSRGGFAMHNPQEEASLKVSAFVLTGGVAEGAGDEGSWTGDSITDRDEARAKHFPFLAQAFKETCSEFGPNDFFVLQKCMKEDAPTPSLKSVVALLKLGDWDPDVFYKFRDIILDQIPSAGHKLRNDLCRGVPRVWENYYMLDKDKDIAFEIGRFFYGIREYEKALRHYTNSSDNIGEHHVTFHNMGLCYYSMGEMTTALECFEKSLAMHNDYEKARTWRDRVIAELKGKEEGNGDVTSSDEVQITLGGQTLTMASAAAEEGKTAATAPVVEETADAVAPPPAPEQ